MIHVALLRGINVGGNNIIPMAALAKTFERLRFTSVKTYIQSGNVIFASPKPDPRALEQTIEKALTKEYDYQAKVVVKSHGEMQAIMRGMPKDWQKPSPAIRYYVMFLRHSIDDKKVVGALKPKPEIETLTYKPGVLFWSAKIDGLTRSGVQKVVSSPIYKDVTIRNLNTTRKLAELMTAVSRSAS